MQYTIRGISKKMDNVAREQAQEYKKSLNAQLLSALAKGLGISDENVRFHDLDDLSGSWVEDDAFNDVIAAFDTVDKDLWK
ncbi:MAG: hypothetical protein JXX29_13065 [Deltaproteobacteria bacterium]|nr:hypothetical protein [Deltaproteobacteria bacterium]MBN2672608.1 hypothetical protein [Deltaproteobacteria bacterium]